MTVPGTLARHATAVAAVAALVVAGCGNPGLDAGAAEDLQQRAAAVRQAVEQGAPGTAASELAGLRAAVAAHEADGAVSAERADDIAAAADVVEARLDLLAPAPDRDATDGPAPAGDDGSAVDEGDDDPPEDSERKDDEDDDEDDDDEEEDRRGPDGDGPPGRQD